MRRRLAVVAARAAWVVRGLWPDRNPLRRTLDRVESAVVTGLAAAFLAGAPLAVIGAAHAAYGVAARTARTQHADWHQVPAVLLTSFPIAMAGYQPTVRAMWTAPDGARRTGMVPVPPVTQAGGTVRVWVDAAGWLTGPPLQPSQVRGQTLLAALFAPVALGLVLLCAGQLARGLLARQRLAAWDAEWQAVGPRWTRHC
jgi:hypothetical protein